MTGSAMRPTEKNRELASLERFTEAPKRFGAWKIALGFPNSYEIGMSNLGFQWVFRLFNRVPDLVCERFFFEEGEPAVTFESGTPVSDLGLLAWSLSWEMDIVNILKTLRAAGIPERREARDERHPVLLVGGDIVSNGTNGIQGATVSGLNVKLGTYVPSSIGNGTKSYNFNSCAVNKATMTSGALITLPNTWVDNWVEY
jgi:hypothetical protein